jgi:hypothetical protein
MCQESVILYAKIMAPVWHLSMRKTKRDLDQVSCPCAKSARLQDTFYRGTKLFDINARLPRFARPTGDPRVNTTVKLCTAIGLLSTWVEEDKMSRNQILRVCFLFTKEINKWRTHHHVSKLKCYTQKKRLKSDMNIAVSQLCTIKLSLIRRKRSLQNISNDQHK